jgi:hypothetical protein
MQNYTQNDYKSQLKNTWLHISFEDDISAELGNVIPYPHHHYMRNNKLVYCWLIDGFFDTLKGVQYLNDIIARFKITFETSQYLKHSIDNESFINPLKLKQFQGLKSRAVQKIIQNSRYDGTRDFIFYCLKLHAEIIIKEKGIFSYDELIDFALINFIDKAKDRSTLKAKCKNIFNWYLERNFELTQTVYVKKEKDLVMATRQEHAKKITKNTSEKYKKKVLNLITGIFKDEYRKKDGSWNVTKIANDSGTTRPTVMKYLPKETLF